MKKQIFVFLLLFLVGKIIAQKKCLDNNSYKNWEKLRGYEISNDGRYVWYEHSYNADSIVLVISDLVKDSTWEYPNCSGATFFSDSKGIVFYSFGGINILNFYPRKEDRIEGVGGYSLPVEGGGWLSYYKDGTLVLKDLLMNSNNEFKDVTHSQFDPTGRNLIVQMKDELKIISLPTLKMVTIMKGAVAKRIAFDATGRQMAFMASNNSGDISLRYYSIGMDSAKIYVDSHTNGMFNREILDDIPAFSRDNKLIYFFVTLKNKIVERPDSSIVTSKVNVWHYKDKYLQREQKERRNLLNMFRAVVSCTGRSFIQIEDSSRSMISFLGNNRILVKTNGNSEVSYWNKCEKIEYEIISIEGERQRLRLDSSMNCIAPQMSPNERFVVWYDNIQNHYFSYEIATGKIRNITKGINAPFFEQRSERLELFPVGTAGWIRGDSAILIYDMYDIWIIDPMARRKPMNITGGWGKMNRIMFRALWEPGKEATLKNGDTLFLTAFNTVNKYNGFWKVRVGNSLPPIPSSNMSPGIYYFPNIFANAPPIPKKAAKQNIFILQYVSAVTAPNLVVTNDFKTFRFLSDIKPQRKYNWLTSELIQWKMLDGRMSSGILYKPENFDPKKKYPLIFDYYEKRSNELYMYPMPGLSRGRINIPWYVSNGYLVFVPDIYYSEGLVGQSVLNSVVSAAKFLSKYSWVDGSKLGLQGHSFGGYETNYLITHSQMFAAAQESAGTCDLISSYGAIGKKSGLVRQKLYEKDQGRLGTTPWKHPDVYVRNSPIFKVDKVTTPLLIMHNEDDEAVPFEQAIELFTALRRLKKTVWLLTYDGEEHVLESEDCKLDFTIRQQQFFNHYLKGEPAPKWMRDGIAADKKGLEAGLDLNQ